MSDSKANGAEALPNGRAIIRLTSVSGLSRRSVLAVASAGAIGVLAEPLMPLKAEDRFVIVDGWVLSEDDLAPPARP